jgi:hypothetical protein
MRTIRVEWLRNCDACGDQVAIVEKEWGVGEIPLTRTNLLRAVHLSLDVSWLGRNLDLSLKARRICYEAVVEPQRVYSQAIAEARYVYYEALSAESLRIYDEAVANPRRIYNFAIAEALFLALQEDER